MQKIILFLILTIVSFSCTTTYKTKNTTTNVQEQNLNSFKDAYSKRLADFTHLQIKSKIDADVNGKSVSATLRLYIHEQQQIWANVSMLGITGARANITPQRVQAYEVLDKTFIDDQFDFLNQKFHVDFIDYTKLQQLLLGQLFLIESWSAYRIETKENNLYALHYKKNQDLLKNPVEGEYVHSFYLDALYRLKKVEIQDIKNNTSITVDYDRWIVTEGNNLPTLVKILVKGEKTDKIEINYNNFEFSAMEPPFRIPKNYKQRALN